MHGAATLLLVLGQHASGASHMLLSEGTSAAALVPTRLCFFFLFLLMCGSALLAAELTRMVAVFAATGSAQSALAIRPDGAAAKSAMPTALVGAKNLSPGVAAVLQTDTGCVLLVCWVTFSCCRCSS